ncbi:hypothetical protein GCM10027275_46140 [Rhabdobacter roseus]|nr:response regulator [Rhabdobacter roseus]
MTDQLHILIVEDEAILALDLKGKLQKEGYLVVGVASSGAKALELFEKHPVDLVLCDISIKGEWDGIETARRMQLVRSVPIIYLTALADQGTLNRALETAPAAYIIKPLNVAQLRIAIELAISNFAKLFTPPDRPFLAPEEKEKDPGRETILQTDESIFIKHNYQFVKVILAQVLYFEADNNYTMLYTATKKYALRLPLSTVTEKIDYPKFLRIHRSYVINIQHVDSFSEHEVTIGAQQLPLGRTYKDDFLRQFLFR